VKLKPIKFLAAYPEGLVELSGDKFSVNGRDLVVHLPRDPSRYGDPFYKVSELNTGFRVPIPQTRDRDEAIALATVQVLLIDDAAWARSIAAAAEQRKALKRIDGGVL
jgi:hypothetical protein